MNVDQKEFQESLGQLTRSASYDPRAPRTYDPNAPKNYTVREDGFIIRDTVRTNTGRTLTPQQVEQARGRGTTASIPDVAEGSALTAGFGSLPTPVLIGGAIVAGIIVMKAFKGGGDEKKKAVVKRQIVKAKIK